MSLPYLPLYIDDYEADTAHLTLLEDGIYNRLLRLCWRSPGCKLPHDEAWLFRKLRASSADEQEAVRAVLSEFFTVSRGKVFSKRLLSEHERVSVAHQRKKEAGKRGAAAKALKSNVSDTSTAKALLKQPEPEPEPYSKKEKASPSCAIALRFAEFWDAYPHRDGKRGRKPTEAKYARLVASGIPEQTLIDAATRYRGDRRVRDGFARDPTTWLNQAGWEDEIDTQSTVAAFPRIRAQLPKEARQ